MLTAITMKYYIALLYCLLFSNLAYCQVDTAQKIIPGRENSAEQEKKALCHSNFRRWFPL